MARLLLGHGGHRGVLTGLVFVAVSINLQEIVSGFRLRGPRRGSSDPVGRRAHGVGVAAGAWAGQGTGRSGAAVRLATWGASW